MADPLSVLRDFHRNKKDILVRDDLLIFGDTAYRKTSKTNYLVWGYENNATKDYYTLECLYFFLQNKDLQHPIYVRNATADHIPVVPRPDRKDLLAYLSGDAATSGRIDRGVPIELAIPFKRAAEEDKNVARKPRVDTEKNIRDREKLQARLEASRDQTATVSTKNLTSLSDAISVEKLAAIKAKRLAQKRAMIRHTDDEVAVGGELQGMLDSEDGLVEIIARERVGRTRADITKGPKNLSERLAPIFQMLKNKEERSKVDPSKTTALKPVQAPAKAATAPVSYSRYDQEQFNRTGGLEFNINPMQSYRGAQDAKVADASPDKVTVRPQQENVNTSMKRPSKTPIIVVPSAPTSLINMYNCTDILQENKYVPSEEKKNAGAKYETDLLIHRKKADGTQVSIRIIDNPVKLSADDWDRVVAVFVQGPAWQFKGWPWNGNPPDIFEKVKAYHIKFDELPTDKNVVTWNVTVVPISRNKRYLDRANLLKFWESLDKFVAKSKTNLRW